MEGESLRTSRAAWPVFHPWLHEVRLTAQRRRGIWLLLAATVTLVLLLSLRPASVEPLLAPLRQWPWLLPVLAAAAAYRLLRSRLIDLRRQWQHGCWAALPIPAPARWRTQLLVAVLLAIVVWLPLQGVLILAWRSAPASAVVSSTLTLAAAITIGAGSGWLSALRAPSLQQEVPLHQGRRDPLWSTRLLHDPRLPWLAEWQRRETTLRWRRGGSALPVAVALCLFPSGAAPPALIALLLFALSLGWLGLALRSSAHVAVQAGTLLRATPVPHAIRLRSLGRYPLFCVVLAAPPGLLLAGLALGGSGLVLWCLLMALLTWPAWASVLPLLRNRSRA